VVEAHGSPSRLHDISAAVERTLCGPATDFYRIPALEFLAPGSAVLDGDDPLQGRNGSLQTRNGSLQVGKAPLRAGNGPLQGWECHCKERT
jgi:hypothetical protein